MLHEDCLAINLTPKKIQKLPNDNTVRYRYYDSTGNLVYKACTKCNAILPSNKFRVRSQGYDGLETGCNDCVLQYERSYHKKNPHVVKNKNKTRAVKLSARTPEQVLSDRARLRPTGEKKCRQCKYYKSLEEFSNSICNPDGLHQSCKDCDKKRQATLRSEDPNYAPAIQKKLRLKNLQRTPEQILRDRERARPTGTKKCQRCKKVISVDLFYSDRGNTDGLASACGECTREYIAWKKRGEVEEQWKSLGIPVECYVCGGPWDHTDHVVPKELQGTNDVSNLLPMCETHNTSKWKTPLDRWLYERHPYEMERILRKVIFVYGVNPFAVN